MTQVTIEDLENGKEDLDNISLFTNSPDPTFVTRLGATRKTIAGITAEYPAAAANAAAAAASASDAEDAQAAAEAAQDAAEAAAAGIASIIRIGDIKETSRIDLDPLFLWPRGQAVSRTTYALLLAATTKTMAATATPGVPGTIDATNTLIAGDKISFETTGTLPAPLAVGVDYFVCSASLSGSSLRVSTSFDNAMAGTAITITDAGTGTLTLRHNPNGCGDGLTTFNVANRQEFGRAAGPTRPIGLEEEDAIQNITGSFAVISGGTSGATGAISLGGPGAQISASLGGSTSRVVTFDASTQVRTDAETRPAYTAMNYMLYAGV